MLRHSPSLASHSLTLTIYKPFTRNYTAMGKGWLGLGT